MISQKIRGFTLIELMIALIVVAILAMIAYPSYVDSVRKSRRSAAMDALMSLQAYQAKWRGNHTSYASNANFTLTTAGNDPDNSYLNYPLTLDFYTISVTANAATTFTATAVVKAGTDQVNDDSDCMTLTINADGPVTTTANEHCWNR